MSTKLFALLQRIRNGSVSAHCHAITSHAWLQTHHPPWHQAGRPHPRQIQHPVGGQTSWMNTICIYFNKYIPFGWRLIGSQRFGRIGKSSQFLHCKLCSTSVPIIKVEKIMPLFSTSVQKPICTPTPNNKWFCLSPPPRNNKPRMITNPTTSMTPSRAWTPKEKSVSSGKTNFLDEHYLHIFP